MSHFMRLSAEVRFIIYGYCLVGGKISPYLEKRPEEERRHLDSCLGLIHANRTIHTEAEPILFQRNKVILPDGPLTAKFFADCLDTPAKRLWLTDVELELCASDMPASVKNSLIQAQPSFSQHHESLKHHIGHVIWPAKVAPIIEHTKLEKLTVRFSESCCPMLCCVLDTRALAAFRKGFAHGIPRELCLQEVTRIMYEPADCRLPARADVEESDFAGMARPVVSDGRVKDTGLPKAEKAGEQIARWTKARDLGKGEDYGDYKWFEKSLEVDDARDGPW